VCSQTRGQPWLVNALAKEMCFEHGELRPRDRPIAVRDLGLVAPDDPVRIANPVYAEVVPRELTEVLRQGLRQDRTWYVDPDGGLNLEPGRERS